MSAEHRLPHELAGLETLLHALTPLPSRIDRDELMYRAGIAAARSQGSQQRWVLPTLTAAAAAIVAVGMTLQFTTNSGLPASEVGLSSVAGLSPARASTDALGPAPDALAVVQSGAGDEKSSDVNRDPAFCFDLRKAPLLAARERALRFKFAEPWQTLAVSGASASDHRASLGQLREEFLPQGTDPAISSDKSLWKWLQPWNHKKEAT